MKTAAVRLQRFAIGIVAVLSLSVSSVAACACSHHDAEVQPEQSCHSSSGHHGQPAKKPDGGGHRVSQTCICIVSATKLSVKSEGFKLKKHDATSSARTSVESARFYSVAPAVLTSTQPEPGSSSFYNSTAARGPPLS